MALQAKSRVMRAVEASMPDWAVEEEGNAGQRGRNASAQLSYRRRGDVTRTP